MASIERVVEAASKDIWAVLSRRLDLTARVVGTSMPSMD